MGSVKGVRRRRTEVCSGRVNKRRNKRDRQKKRREGGTNTQRLLFWSLWICGCCGEKKGGRKRMIENNWVSYVPSSLVYQ